LRSRLLMFGVTRWGLAGGGLSKVLGRSFNHKSARGINSIGGARRGDRGAWCGSALPRIMQAPAASSACFALGLAILRQSRRCRLVFAIPAVDHVGILLCKPGHGDLAREEAYPNSDAHRPRSNRCAAATAGYNFRNSAFCAIRVHAAFTARRSQRIYEHYPRSGTNKMCVGSHRTHPPPRSGATGRPLAPRLATRGSSGKIAWIERSRPGCFPCV